MNGFFNVIKPSGMTASDVVVFVRRVLKEKKVGHLGTLDPLATGVLPVAVGKGTKLFNLLLNKRKTYLAFFTFGTETDTLDSDGQIVRQSETLVSAEQIKEACKLFLGKQIQIPPQYSAKKVNGLKAYDLARKGETVELKGREIEIFKFDFLRQKDEKTFVFEIECSSGTYIRSIVRDLAEKLNTVGYMSALIRTQSGPFSVVDGFTLDEIEKEKENLLVPIEFALNDLSDFIVDEKLYKKLCNGVKIQCEFDGYRKIFCDGEFFGVGKSEKGFLDLEFYLK